MPTAANEEVRTTRRTPASRAARSTRRVPSRAGRTSSSGSFGTATGNGEATCRTSRHPATASSQPASESSSASTTSSPSASTPARATRAWTAGARRIERTVVRTR